MNHHSRVAEFSGLHRPGQPLVLYNIWDAGSARAVAAAGAAAIATGSASVAAAQGYEDGEQLPLDDLVRTVEQIVRAVALPVSVDIESGYGATGAGETARRIAAAGALGCNVEDQIIGGEGLFTVAEQVERLGAMASTLRQHDLALHINARTDVFLAAPDEATHCGLLPAALARADAYYEAGASSFFVPWLRDTRLIGELCERAPLPVNVMWREGMAGIRELAAAGVARISFGPGPYRESLARLTAAAETVYSTAGENGSP